MPARYAFWRVGRPARHSVPEGQAGSHFDHVEVSEIVPVETISTLFFFRLIPSHRLAGSVEQ
jgi:hypothetical protein